MDPLTSLIPQLGAVGAVIYLVIYLITKLMPRQAEEHRKAWQGLQKSQHELHQAQSKVLGKQTELLSALTVEVRGLSEKLEKVDDKVESLSAKLNKRRHTVDDFRAVARDSGANPDLIARLAEELERRSGGGGGGDTIPPSS